MSLLRSPRTGWAVAVLLALTFVLRPRTVTTIKTEFKERVVVRTQYRARLVAQSGTTVTQAPDGTITTTGPVTIEREGNSTSDKADSSRTSTVKRSAMNQWSVGVGALFPPPYLGTSPQWTVLVGRRMLGPVWFDAGVILPAAGSRGLDVLVSMRIEM